MQSILKLNLTNNLTLFLDRDGVVNYRPVNDYVKNWEEFHFLPGVLDAMKMFSGFFQRIIIVTNQQGIGKNLMTMEDLHKIHQRMIDEIELKGGRIDRIYYCPDLASKSDNCRKPGIKMAEMAQNDFPEIEFKNCVMVGDTETDMEFGRKIGMTTVLIGSKNEPVGKDLIDFTFDQLINFARSLPAND